MHYANFQRNFYQFTKCMMLDCTIETMYEIRLFLILHLKRLHKFTYVQVLQHVFTSSKKK